jgi:hypothetical protein
MFFELLAQSFGPSFGQVAITQVLVAASGCACMVFDSRGTSTGSQVQCIGKEHCACMNALDNSVHSVLNGLPLAFLCFWLTCLHARVGLIWGLCLDGKGETDWKI